MTVTFRADEELVEQIDGWSTRLGVSRSEATRMLVLSSLRNPDRIAAIMQGYQQGLRMGGQQFAAMTSALSHRAGSLMQALDAAVASASTMQAVPVAALLPVETG